MTNFVHTIADSISDCYPSCNWSCPKSSCGRKFPQGSAPKLSQHKAGWDSREEIINCQGGLGKLSTKEGVAYHAG